MTETMIVSMDLVTVLIRNEEEAELIISVAVKTQVSRVNIQHNNPLMP